MTSPSTRRRNGFSKPFPPMQVATWFFLPLLNLQFLFFVSPILPVAASIPCTLLYFAFAFASAYYTYLACITDPIDVYLAKHIAETASSNHEENQSNNFLYRGPNISAMPQEEEQQKYCWVCETQVAEHSMHCKYCNKCVSHFDHHCLWLNTCVGDANYGYFYKILWTICGMLVVHTSCMLGIVIDVLTGGSLKERADAWFGANASVAVAAVNIVFILCNIVCLSLVGQLLNFHIGLQRKNLTTYQYIVTDNARRREAFQKKEERRTKRATAVTKARQEGKPILGLRLELGQFCCPPCDPLPDEEAPPNTTNNTFTNGDGETAGYAALSDDNAVGVASTEEDDKGSLLSDRDIARTHAASLGESSSSQLEQKNGGSMTSATDLPRSNGTSLGESSSSQLEGGKSQQEVVATKSSVDELADMTSQVERADEVDAADTLKSPSGDVAETKHKGTDTSIHVQEVNNNNDEKGNDRSDDKIADSFTEPSNERKSANNGQ